jgi:outer membrane receptor for Fe3+-dicitrate
VVYISIIRSKTRIMYQRHLLHQTYFGKDMKMIAKSLYSRLNVTRTRWTFFPGVKEKLQIRTKNQGRKNTQKGSSLKGTIKIRSMNNSSDSISVVW